jgi:hypothetical protein
MVKDDVTLVILMLARLNPGLLVIFTVAVPPKEKSKPTRAVPKSVKDLVWNPREPAPGKDSVPDVAGRFAPTTVPTFASDIKSIAESRGRSCNVKVPPMVVRDGDPK